MSEHRRQGTREEAARDRQPVSAHGQRRHDARRALHAAPAGRGLGAIRADGEGDGTGGGARRPYRPGRRSLAEEAARGRPAELEGEPLGGGARPLLRLGRTGRAQGPGDPEARTLRRRLQQLAARERASRRRRPLRAGGPSVARRLPRPVVDVPVPAVPHAGAQGRPPQARSVGAGTRHHGDRRQPAHRRRPRRAPPVALRPRARAPQRVRPRRAAGGGHARRRLLDRAHRPTVRPRAAGGRVSRGARGAAAVRQGAVRRRRREPRAAGRGPLRARRPRPRRAVRSPAGRARVPARGRRAASGERTPAREHVEQGVRVSPGRPADLRHLAGRLGRPGALR